MLKKIIKGILIILIFPWVYGILLNFINPPFTITQISNLLAGYSLKRNYLSSEEIPNYARWALVAAEDQNFAQHNGFDFGSMKKAFENNQKGRKLRGGSTISQQTAKNIFAWQGRTYFRKAVEAYATLILESVTSKKRILDLYLNSVEMGKGVYGIEAAAQYYFKKEANQLTNAEISKIIAALPSPKKYNVNPASGYINKRASWIQRNVRNLKDNTELKKIIE